MTNGMYSMWTALSLDGACRTGLRFGLPALLALALAAPAHAQDDDDGGSKPVPEKPERIRPLGGGAGMPGANGMPMPGSPNGLPADPQAGKSKDPQQDPGQTSPTKGSAEGDKSAVEGGTGTTGGVTTKKVPCVEPTSKVTIDFVDAPLMDVAKYMAEITCRNFILGDDLKGQVTIISHQQVSVSEAYEAFLSSLEVAGYTTVTVGQSTKIVATSKAANAPLRVYEGDNIPGTDNFVTQIIELDNVTVADISTVVKELSGPSAKVIAYSPTNTLILTDAAYNIRRVYRIIKQMDVAAPKSHIEVLPIHFATAADVERILEDVYGVAASTSSASSSSTSATSATSAAERRRARRTRDDAAATESTGASSTNVGAEGAFISKIIADERTNSIILLANDEAITKVKELVARIDIDIDPASRSQIHVIYLDHANASDVAGVLSSLSQGTGGGGGGGRSTSSSRSSNRSQQGGSRNQQSGGNRGGGGGSSFGGGGGGGGGFGGGGGSKGGGFPAPYEPGGAGATEGVGTGGVAAAFDSGSVRITADENTNSLVLLASPEDFRVLKGVIDRLDIPRRQVYVEAVVVEVGSQDELDMGIGYHFGNANDSGGISYGSAQMNASSFGINTADLLSGLAMGVFGQAIPVTLADGSVFNVPAFGIALNALASNSAVNILSNPNILVLDNEEATINVGRNVPFPVSAGRDNNGQPIISYQREDVGITLEVTPQINESNYVTLEMSLEVAEVEEDSSGLDVTTAGFITSKRQTDNVVVVRDNQTIVIGGLIGNTKTEVETKIPILGDIPLIGVLFRGKRNTERKTNLLIFLTPHVINEPADLEEVYRVKVAQREEFLRRFYGKSRDKQEAELKTLLRGSMNLVDEPSQYRTKAPPKGSDEAMPDGTEKIEPPTNTSAPTSSGTGDTTSQPTDGN
jgi:general secretion pathway protein D